MSDQSGFKLIFRAMRSEDIPEVHAIDEISFDLPWTERSYLFEVTQNAASRPWVAEIVDQNNHRAIAAMAVFWLIVDEIHIATIAVHPDFRQKGIGQKFLAHTLLSAANEGAVIAFLEVRRSNLPAQALYQKFGFVETGIRPHYYRNNMEDALLMTLEPLDKPRLQKLAE